MREGRAENERWHLRKDGSRFWGSGAMTALRDKDDTLRGFCKAFLDKTEQRRAEVDLRGRDARIGEGKDSPAAWNALAKAEAGLAKAEAKLAAADERIARSTIQHSTAAQVQAVWGELPALAERAPARTSASSWRAGGAF